MGTQEENKPALADQAQNALTPRQVVDQLLAADTMSAAQDALQEALTTRAVLREADADLVKAQATRDQAKRNHEAACAKLIPFQRLARVAA